MIHELKAINIQGIDLVISRYQTALESRLSDDWDIYPRLEMIKDEWRYYTGKDREHTTVDYSEKRNMIGFGVQNITHLGNQSQCDLTVIVSTQHVGDTRDIQSLYSEVQNILDCTYQTTACTFKSIEPSTDERHKQPSIDFTITIEAKFVPNYKLN